MLTIFWSVKKVFIKSRKVLSDNMQDVVTNWRKLYLLIRKFLLKNHNILSSNIFAWSSWVLNGCVSLPTFLKRTIIGVLVLFLKKENLTITLFCLYENDMIGQCQKFNFVKWNFLQNLLTNVSNSWRKRIGISPNHIWIQKKRMWI